MSNTTRELPYSKESEDAIIGSILLDPTVIEFVELNPSDFFQVSHQHIFQAMLSLFREGTPPDLLLTTARLERDGQLDRVGGVATLSRCAAEIPVPVYVQHYASVVKREAERRAIIEHATKIVTGAYADPAFSRDHPLVQGLTSQVTNQKDGPVWISDAMTDFRQDILDTWANRKVKDEVPLGFRHLDHALRGGLRPGELCIIAARPGMGKTALMLQVALNVARRNQGAVLIFSAEMSLASLLLRALSETTCFAGGVIERGALTDVQRNAILEGTGFLERLPIAIDDKPAITTQQIARRVSRVQRTGKVAIVLFDYIELAGDEPRRGEGEVQRVGEIGAALKRGARECAVPFVALSQLSRAVEQRADRRPTMSDLRQSGALEAHADQIMLLYREEYYVQLGVLPSTGKEGICDVILAKQRNGPTGVFSLRFDPVTMQFDDLDAPRRRFIP